MTVSEHKKMEAENDLIRKLRCRAREDPLLHRMFFVIDCGMVPKERAYLEYMEAMDRQVSFLRKLARQLLERSPRPQLFNAEEELWTSLCEKMRRQPDEQDAGS